MQPPVPPQLNQWSLQLLCFYNSGLPSPTTIRIFCANWFFTTSKQGSVFSTVCDFFVCASNISGTAERICAKFTVNMCLVPRSDEFECQGQRWRSPGTKIEKLLRYPHWQCIGRRALYAVHDVIRVRVQSGPFHRSRGGDGSACWRRLACGVCWVKHP